MTIHDASRARLRRSSDRGASALARQFGDALRVADGDLAEKVVEEAFALGFSPAAIQSTVITPAMVRIGELWENGVLSVADEHVATAISEQALARIFRSLLSARSGPPTRECVLLAAVEGQRHVMGLRMIADVLEGAGFEVLNLGADVSVARLEQYVAAHEPAVVGLSFGIARDVGKLADSLSVIHQAQPKARIMLGGRAIPPALWNAGYPRVGSSVEVVTTVEDLIAAPPQALPTVVSLLRGSRDGDESTREPDERDTEAERLAGAAERAGDVIRSQLRRDGTDQALSFNDALTGLANRRVFEERREANGKDSGGAVLMIGVDDFEVADSQQTHDQALRAIGQAIGLSVRPGDLAARFGGHEFAVLLPGATPEVADQVAARVRDAVGSATVSSVTVSIGVSQMLTASSGPLSPVEAHPNGALTTAHLDLGLTYDP